MRVIAEAEEGGRAGAASVAAEEMEAGLGQA